MDWSEIGEMKNSRLLPMLGLTVLALGVLVIGSQYARNIDSGASADAPTVVAGDSAVSISAQDYARMRQLIGEYFAKSDLASKNRIMAEVKSLSDSWNGGQ